VLAALLPCMWGYSELGRSMAATGLPADPRYRRWIQTYADPEFGPGRLVCGPAGPGGRRSASGPPGRLRTRLPDQPPPRTRLLGRQRTQPTGGDALGALRHEVWSDALSTGDVGGQKGPGTSHSLRMSDVCKKEAPGGSTQ
jgi:hypothetical protein